MDGSMEIIREYLPILIPLVIIQAALFIAALVHILRNNNYKTGNRALWIVVVVLIGVIGPVLYFCLGRGDSEDSE